VGNRLQRGAHLVGHATVVTGGHDRAEPHFVQEPSRAIPGARVQALERELAAVCLEYAYAAANAMSR
jgi:hypothetical protein